MRLARVTALAALPVWLLCVLAARPVAAQGLPTAPAPAGNPTTAAKVLLGAALFWDEQLSSARTVACGTCHLPEAGGADSRATRGPVHPGVDGVFGTGDDVHGSMGIVRRGARGQLLESIFGIEPQVTTRKAPSVINAAFAPELFWDGRAADVLVDPVTGITVLSRGAALESQALQPLVSDVEMAHVGFDWSSFEQRLGGLRPLALAEAVPSALAAFVHGRSYGNLFDQVFGQGGVTAVRVAMALAAYQRTLVSGDSRWDRWRAGDPTALNAAEVRGRNLFFGAASCDQCHSGDLLTDHSFRNIGVRPWQEDSGRMQVTQATDDRGRFAVPSLRNVALRAPFFHSGSAATLGEVIEFYDRAGDFRENIDPLMVPLGLSVQDKADLEAFLRTLTDPLVAAARGPFKRPRLYGESSSRLPRIVGHGSGHGVGSPRTAPLDPAHLGNPRWQVPLDRATPFVPAFLCLDGAVVTSPLPVQGIQVFLATSPVLVVAGGAMTGVGGQTSMVFSLPNPSSLVGQTVAGQWLLLDPSAPQGLAASNAFVTRLF